MWYLLSSYSEPEPFRFGQAGLDIFYTLAEWKFEIQHLLLESIVPQFKEHTLLSIFQSLTFPISGEEEKLKYSLHTEIQHLGIFLLAVSN